MLRAPQEESISRTSFMPVNQPTKIASKIGAFVLAMGVANLSVFPGSLAK